MANTQYGPPTGVQLSRSARRRNAQKAPNAKAQDRALLQRDNQRARAENRLLENTKALPRKCGLALHQIRRFEALFRSKKALPSSEAERNHDDRLRRAAVHQIFRAREAAGIERVGEAKFWSPEIAKNLNVTQALNAKFNIKSFSMKIPVLSDGDHFNTDANRTEIDAMRKRHELRRKQSRFLECTLAQPNGGGIPAARAQWLRNKINNIIRPHEHDSWVNLTLASIQVVYYIIACRKAVGRPLIIEPICEGDNGLMVHQWLEALPMSFFERDDFASEVVAIFESSGMSVESLFEIEVHFKELMKEEQLERVRGEKQTKAHEVDGGEDAEGDPTGKTGNHGGQIKINKEPGSIHGDDEHLGPESISDDEYMQPEPVLDREYE